MKLPFVECEQACLGLEWVLLGNTQVKISSKGDRKQGCIHAESTPRRSVRGVGSTDMAGVEALTVVPGVGMRVAGREMLPSAAAAFKICAHTGVRILKHA